MFTEYRKIHIVVIAKLGINNIYTYRQLCWERGNIHCVRPLGRMHTILVIYYVQYKMFRCCKVPQASDDIANAAISVQAVCENIRSGI